ncbi:hypothetical protein A2635_00845 [Candidatus Peribacteria bacterium RIFCSPHIGHO2_01_FULL_51_9]|nr:MAG: hypothetical protein A2635_00845 [Candidatus Peribacteria bacterium RIFCSPHIGHO2_01_FULL_51_9]
MRILFTRFPLSSAYGGAEVQTLSLMEGLRKRGHEVVFLGSCPVLLDWIPELDLEKHELRIGDPPVTAWGALSFFWRQFFMKYKLTQAIKKLTDRSASIPGMRDRQDLKRLSTIFMLSLSEKILFTEWAVQKGIKVFWIEHDRIGHWLTHNPWLSRLRQLSNLVTTICVSELSRKMYIDLGWDPKRVIAIPNGIDERRLSSSNEQSGNKNFLHIGCVARLSPDKGIDLLIKAIADLPTVHLTIVGRGNDVQSLTTLIEQTNTQCHGERILLRPFIEDLGSFYRSLDILVLPSREHDPFGLVAAEAMLCGVPVIVTDTCGIASYLRNGIDALIVASNSDLALQKAIFSMHDPNVRFRIAQEGQKTAREKFTLEKMVDTYEEYIRATCIPCHHDPGVSK